MIAVIYARYSSDNQTEMSIDAQVRACTEYANKKNITIIKTYVDEATTGTNANRSGYQEMLADAFDEKFDLILIHKYDRIARNLEEQVTLRSRLKKLNIRLIAVAQDYGEGKDAELSKGIQWVLGEYYSANLSEETKKGHKEIALKGLHNGGVAPFGYDIVDQHYVINEIEAYYVKWMYQNCLEGKGYSEILEALNKANIKGKRGKPIKYSQIYEILNNEKYTGTYVYCETEETNRNLRREKPNAIRIENAFSAIIDKDTFLKVKNIMKSRKHASIQKHRCSGLVYCSNCGAPMHINHSKSKGHEYVRFVCSKKCGASSVPADFVDECVDSYMLDLFSEKNMSAVESAMMNLSEYNKDSTKEFEKQKNNKIAQAELELKNITNGLMSGAFEGNFEYCNKLITEKRNEIESLKKMKLNIIEESQIRKWLNAIVESNYSPRIFIERIEANTTSVKIISNFSEVVGKTGCGGTFDIKNTTSEESEVVCKSGCGEGINLFPTTLFEISYSNVSC